MNIVAHEVFVIFEVSVVIVIEVVAHDFFGVSALSFARNDHASFKIFTMTDGELSVETPRVRGK